MDARSPLSPRKSNLTITPETVKDGLRRVSTKRAPSRPAATVVSKPVITAASPRTRRPSLVSWLANFEGEDMKDSAKGEDQLGSILSPHDHNLAKSEEPLKSSKKLIRSPGVLLDVEELRRNDSKLAQESSYSSHNTSSVEERVGRLEQMFDHQDHGNGQAKVGTLPEAPRTQMEEEKEEEANRKQSAGAALDEDNGTEPEDADWEPLPSDKEIATYAEYLGMKPKEDAELLWIAEQAMLCPVPDGWQEGVDSDGLTYFYELDTMTSCRAHPCDDDYEFLYKGLRRAVQESAVTFEAVVIMADHLGIDVATEPHLLWVARHALLAPLLPGWEEMEDEEGSYYYDRRAERSTGEHPIDAFFSRLIETERMKRRSTEGETNVELDSKDQEACIMELLDESTGDLYTFDWCKAEMHEPTPADAGALPSRQPSLAVLQNVASSLWKAPLGALTVLGRICSALVRGRRV